MSAISGRARSTFGVPLADHRGWRWTIAEASAELAAARLLAADAAARIDTSADARLAAAQAKLVATRTAECQLPRLAQAMSAEGLREVYPFGRHMNDAPVASFVDGSSEMLLERIAAVLRRGRSRHSGALQTRAKVPWLVGSRRTSQCSIRWRATRIDPLIAGEGSRFPAARPPNRQFGTQSGRCALKRGVNLGSRQSTVEPAGQRTETRGLGEQRCGTTVIFAPIRIQRTCTARSTHTISPTLRR